MTFKITAAIFVVMAISLAGCNASNGNAGSTEISSSTASTAAYTVDASTDKIAVYFSPKHGCTDAICREIRAAKHEILVQAYSFTSKPIANALVDACRRGVKITVIIDRKQSGEPGNKAGQLADAGAVVLLDGVHAIAHNKIMLIDSKTVITGSFNFTNQAENSNAENVLMIHDMPDLFGAYARNFTEHRKHSEAYVNSK